MTMDTSIALSDSCEDLRQVLPKALKGEIIQPHSIFNGKKKQTDKIVRYNPESDNVITFECNGNAIKHVCKQ